MARSLIKLPAVYVNSGKRDVTLNGYFNMPTHVMRGGVMVAIADINAAARKRKA